jgi:hypothetical protein
MIEVKAPPPAGHYYNRVHVLLAGCAIWGFFTICFSLATTVHQARTLEQPAPAAHLLGCGVPAWGHCGAAASWRPCNAAVLLEPGVHAHSRTPRPHSPSPLPPLQGILTWALNGVGLALMIPNAQVCCLGLGRSADRDWLATSYCWLVAWRCCLVQRSLRPRAYAVHGGGLLRRREPGHCLWHDEPDQRHGRDGGGALRHQHR